MTREDEKAIYAEYKVSLNIFSYVLFNISYKIGIRKNVSSISSIK
jgi:hypothetical protein